MAGRVQGLRWAPLGIVLMALALLFSASAEALKLSGGGGNRIEKVTLRVQKNRHVDWALFEWSAKCERGAYAIPTKIGGKLDVDRRGYFRDKDTYTNRAPKGYRYRITVMATGRQVGDRKWRGSFKGRVEVRRYGRELRTCASGRRGWSAKVR